MQLTFILAGNFGVTPFEIMRQDLDEIIMVVKYLSESGKASKKESRTTAVRSEKENDKNFWAAL